MGRKPEKISITSLAAELEISPASVSRVINNRTGVSEETRRAVHALLRKYDFKVNYPAARQPKIAVAVSGMNIVRYVACVLDGINHALQKNELAGNMIFHDPTSGESLLSTIRDQQCAGAILLVPARFEAELPELSVSGLPIMLVDESTSLPNIGFIDNDSYFGSRCAVEYLIGQGHRRIAYLGLGGTLNHLQRFSAYENAMKSAGLPIDPAWIPTLQIQSENSLEHGRALAAKLLDAAPDITAMLTTNDELAWGALRELHRRKLRVPEDISLIGFDDYDMSAFCEPPLSTVRHPMRQAGAAAVNAIARYLAENGRNPLPREILQTSLVIRQSSGQVRPA